MASVLVVEDDQFVRSALIRHLTEAAHIVRSVGTALEALREVAHFRFDVVILDLGLPDLDGSEALKMLRGITDVPVIVATARDDESEAVRLLNAGADDYLTKPFAFRELVARVRALARRPPTTLAETIVIADLSVDIPGHRVRRGPRDIELTAKEFALLECLVRHRGRVVDRATITAHVWDDNHDPFTNVLEVLVRRLRRKIDDGFDVKLIHTLRGAGYRLGA